MKPGATQFTVMFRLAGVSAELLDSDVLYPVLGNLIGSKTGTGVPVVEGLPAGLGEDRLKALGRLRPANDAYRLFAVRADLWGPDVRNGPVGTTPVHEPEKLLLGRGFTILRLEAAYVDPYGLQEGDVLL